jgi:hypothetical protein
MDDDAPIRDGGKDWHRASGSAGASGSEDTVLTQLLGSEHVLDPWAMPV